MSFVRIVRPSPQTRQATRRPTDHTVQSDPHSKSNPPAGRWARARARSESEAVRLSVMKAPLIVLLLATSIAASSRVGAARKLAHGVLVRCAKTDAYADRALHSAFSKSELTNAQRAQATDIVYGVMRSGSQLDYQLQKLTSPNFARKTDLDTLCALRMGAFELLRNSTPDFAAVNEAVSLAGSRKQQRSFVNGVLRNLARRREQGSLPSTSEDAALSRLEALAIDTSTPLWLLRELGEPKDGLLPSFGELSEWAWASQARPDIAIRVNRCKATRELVEAKLQGAGLSVKRVEGLSDALLLEAGGGKLSTLPGFAEGEWSVQDVGAQLVALLAVAHASSGCTALDLCAAPGGKTTHLAELLSENGGRVISVEVHRRKAKLIQESIGRLGLSRAEVAVADATDADGLLELLASKDVDEGADVVVVDAPCSGTGTLRRNPEHRYRADDPSKSLKLCELQASLLDAAAKCVRKGGVVTYSVCSPRRAETDEVVAKFLERNRGFELVGIGDALSPFVAHSDALGGAGTCVRTWTHKHPADSHFVAQVRRLC